MTHKSVVAAGHPETVAAASEVLEAGGNAFDAAVAAGFAAAVTEPGLTSLGGGGFLLASVVGPAGRDGPPAEEVLFDFFVDTPGLDGDPTGHDDPHLVPITVHFKSTDQVFWAGHGSVAVPGCLAGYLHVHERLGRLDLADIVAPARRLAVDGVVINEQQAEVFGLLQGIFALTDAGRRVFAPDGRLLTRGDTVHNGQLGAFLGDLADGRASGFADAPVSSAIARDMTTNGGLLTSQDLESYRVIERDPLIFSYDGARIATNPPPSFGGSIIAAALNQLGDTVALDDIARALRQTTDDHRRQPPQPRASRGTTHVSVSDREGNVATMTTSNGTCSGVFAGDTGVQLNNIMGEEDLHPGGFHTLPPGHRIGSMMAPTIAHLDGGPAVALGSGGSERIRSAITQVLVNLIRRDMSLQEAVDAPRVHWDGSGYQVEPGAPSDEVERLEQTETVNRWDVRNLYFGGAHAVSTEGDAAGDPRRGGSTAVV